MKLAKPRITPNVLIILGVVMLLAVFSIYFIIDKAQEVNRLHGEVETLTLERNQAQRELDEVNATLAEEKGKIGAAKELHNFSTLEELEQFLAQDDTDSHEYIKNDFDCDDFAHDLQEHAFERGYIMNCQILPIGGLRHMMNMAIAGNKIYYIEPTTDEITFVHYVD